MIFTAVYCSKEESHTLSVSQASLYKSTFEIAILDEKGIKADYSKKTDKGRNCQMFCMTVIVHKKNIFSVTHEFE